MKTVLNCERLNRVLAQMERMGLSQMILSSPYTIDYLTGVWIKPFERMYVLYLRTGEIPVLFYGSVNGSITVQGAETVSCGPMDRPVRMLADRLSPGTVGVDREWSARFLLPLMEYRPDVRLVQGAEAVELVRMVKDPEEQERMRQASRMDDGVFERAFQSITGEETELQLSNRMGHFFEEAIGTHMGVSMVAFGANAANPHHAPGHEKPARGGCILIDSGKALNKYMSDMTRTVFFQEVSQRHRELYQIVREANQAGIETIRPGIDAVEVDRAARKVIEEAGYGPFFVHRVGHGIGREGHEYPSIGGFAGVTLEPGMCFTVEPGIYLSGEVGIRIEDVVLVTKTGVEVLNHYRKDLQVIG
ncbi:Xaa-Pro peptidase family protein [Cuneatibacter sp. NSJ-177]|uniref:M24 family metallopeptidase n=1 Tax=Cuneatibacter sp. NSJ-177 TaxID=2931401 RepID=UPI001FD01B9F|nr:Xaa-Pro peptidase family protein [Cuneatibacter sp. NSJ-177]MCJ7837107.1 Xaa-Pro peptidase family protein [Cuneatibacter sp. NSJ-177]